MALTSPPRCFLSVQWRCDVGAWFSGSDPHRDGKGHCWVKFYIFIASSANPITKGNKRHIFYVPCLSIHSSSHSSHLSLRLICHVFSLQCGNHLLSVKIMVPNYVLLVVVTESSTFGDHLSITQGLQWNLVEQHSLSLRKHKLEKKKIHPFKYA